MLHIGVDPGKQGAIAGVWEDGRVAFALAMPLVTSTKRRDEYDVSAIVDLLRDREASAFVTVELIGPIPPTIKAGGLAQYQRGVSRGGWEWMLTALRVPFELVRPQEWQSEMLAGASAGDTKQAALIVARRLWPMQDFRASARCRVAHDGIVDALLLAEYGRRHRGEL
jgi:hypothetical protein